MTTDTLVGILLFAPAIIGGVILYGMLLYTAYDDARHSKDWLSFAAFIVLPVWGIGMFLYLLRLAE